MSISAVSNLTPLPVLSAVDAKRLSSAASTPSADQPTKLPIYATPVYQFDAVANIPIELIRDPSTGKVLNQIPSEQIVQKYRLHQLPASDAQASTATPAGRATAGAAANKGAVTTTSSAHTPVSFTV